MHDLEEYSKTFHEEIQAEAHALDALREEIFVQKMGDMLEEYGELPVMSPSAYRSAGVKVDGYYFDDELKDLTLVVSHYLDDGNLQKVSNTEVSAVFKRAVTFFTRSLRALHDRIEISNEAHDLASFIYSSKNEIRNVKIILITDGIAQKRSAEIDDVDGIEITQTVWDMERAFNFCRTGEREKISLDFEKYCGEPLSCVVMDNGNGVYT